jgi:hypothetical protein
MDSGSANPIDRFSLVAGGPFHRVLHRLGWIGADRLPTRHAAIGLALFAWLPPALLAIAQTLLDSSYSGWGYFTDLTVPARYLLAIWVMVMTERYADGRLVILVREFREANLISRNDLPAFESALDTADRRSSSALAEGVMVAVALTIPGFVASYAVALAGSSWEGTVVGGEVVLSWAGKFARFVSAPLFAFLALRWIWWFLVWAALLYRISRLPLQLIPTHPDRSGGLGFLAIFPGIFSGFSFALSCMVASAMLKDLGLEKHAPEIVWFAMAVWLAINLSLFLGPLLVFAGPLYAARERALLDYGRLSALSHLAFRRKWFREAGNGDTLEEAPDLPSASDLNASVQAVREMQFAPIDRVAVIQVVVAAGLPLLAVVTTLVPLDDILKYFLRKLL